MRISDWSSDVCSSDLLVGGAQGQELTPETGEARESDGGQPAEQQRHRAPGGAAVQPATQGGEGRRAVALLERAGQEEEQAGDQAVRHRAEEDRKSGV